MQRIFVGDVQGCADELAELVERARSEFGDRCEVWLVGDLVNRGPGNLQVLRHARELVESGRGRVVLGNHDLALIMTALGLRGLGPRDTTRDVLEAPDVDDWIEWLRRQPLAATGEIAGQPFAMVHASVHPDWALDDVTRCARRLEAQLGAPDRESCRAFLARSPDESAERDELARFTRCRSVDVDGRGGWSDRLPEADTEPWHAAWRRRGHAYGVVYGHWALQGLHVDTGLRGLDTGCVHHGRDHEGALTAWVPDEDGADPFGLPDDRFWHVPARRMYYDFP